jgi:dUTP pyrophosphatase
VSRDVVLKVRRLRAGGLPLPAYMTSQAAGMDVYADVEGELVIPPLGRALIPTGLAVAIPPGFEAQVRPRSGLALRSGLTLLNSPGTIDADYREEIKILVVNLGAEPVRVRRGERVAQIVVAPVMRARWEEGAELDETGRGGGGCGHTGR